MWNVVLESNSSIGVMDVMWCDLRGRERDVVECFFFSVVPHKNTHTHTSTTVTLSLSLGGGCCEKHRSNRNSIRWSTVGVGQQCHVCVCVCVCVKRGRGVTVEKKCCFSDCFFVVVVDSVCCVTCDHHALCVSLSLSLSLILQPRWKWTKKNETKNVLVYLHFASLVASLLALICSWREAASFLAFKIDSWTLLVSDITQIFCCCLVFGCLVVLCWCFVLVLLK